MSDKYSFPFYKYPNPPHNRISPRKLESVYSERIALYYCGKFNLEDKLEKLSVIVLKDEDKTEYKVLYINPDSIHHLRSIKNIDSERYVYISEVTRNSIAEEIKILVAEMEALNE